jgi:transposase
VLNLTANALKVFLALDPCDIRKSFNGLQQLAEDQLGAIPARDALFVFTNKRRNRRNRLKLLYFDGTGLWVAAKRLEKGRFSWPAPSEPGQRRIKLGMKNWMFFGSLEAGTNNALIDTNSPVMGEPG